MRSLLAAMGIPAAGDYSCDFNGDAGCDQSPPMVIKWSERSKRPLSASMTHPFLAT
jgi:hypothetical protein